MAELTAMRNTVLPYPIYGLPYVVAFPILDEDGDPVTGLTPDTEISKNGDTAVDTATEAAEIAFDTATNKGMYQLQLSAAEMTCDVAAITVYTGVTTAQATCIVLYPRKLPPVASGTATAGAAGTITLQAGSVPVDDYFNGAVIYISSGTGSGQCRMITDYVGSTRVASVTPNFATNPSSDSVYTIYLTDIAVNALLSNLSAIALAAINTANAQIGVNVVSQANIDFGALQKASITAAVPTVAQIQTQIETEGGLLDIIEDKLPAGNIGDATAANQATIIAKTNLIPASPAAVGSQMDLVNAPNATAITAIQSGLSTLTDALVWAYGTRTLSSFGTLIADIFAYTIEGSLTFIKAIRIKLAALAGKSSGGGSATLKFRDTADSKDRITATVDLNGNRTGMTLDGT